MPLIAAHKLSVNGGNPQIYNGFDTTQLHPILDKLLSLPRPGPIYDFERALQGVAMEMSLRGILVNQVEHEKTVLDVSKKRDDLDDLLQTLAHAVWQKPLNYNSPKEQIDFFYNHLNIERIEKRFQGEVKLPMDAITLEKLQQNPYARVFASLIIKCKELRLLLNRLNTEIDVEKDGTWRLRTSNNITGTNEGRWSNSESALGTGGNLQNITESLRRMFTSDPGRKLFGIDKEQAEARWVGFYCGILLGDWSYLDLLESGDGHTAVARMVWKDLPWTGDLKRDRQVAEKICPSSGESYRQTSKKLSHATNIGGRPPQIAAQIRVPVRLVEEYQEGYFDVLPCISRYQTWIANKIQTTQRLRNAFGRPRDFFDRPDSYETVKKGLAFMQASSSADDLNLGLWRTWYYMGERIELLTQEHDAIYGQFPETLVEEEVIQEIQTHLDVVFNTQHRIFSVPTEAKTGWNKGLRWEVDREGNRKEINPKGLDKVGAKR